MVLFCLGRYRIFETTCIYASMIFCPSVWIYCDSLSILVRIIRVHSFQERINRLSYTFCIQKLYLGVFHPQRRNIPILKKIYAYV